VKEESESGYEIKSIYLYNVSGTSILASNPIRQGIQCHSSLPLALEARLGSDWFMGQLLFFAT
jgi:hypothetical protein